MKLTSTRTRRSRIPWVKINAIAAVAGAVFAGLALCRPGSGSDPPGLESTEVPETRVSVPADAPAAPADGTSTAPLTYLVDLEPARSQGLADLPSALAGEPGYEHSLVIACPSNQTGDQISEVAYETRNRYDTFEATLRPYRDPPDDVLVQVQVFSDPPDRGPGVPAGGEPSDPIQARMGQQAPVSVTIDRAYYLRLRVACEKPGGFVILAGAVVAASR